ncbi:hypothetical protein JCM8097_001671 [Rhodosporidiobolus ruineniae]
MRASSASSATGSAGGSTALESAEPVYPLRNRSRSITANLTSTHSHKSSNSSKGSTNSTSTTSKHPHAPTASSSRSKNGTASTSAHGRTTRRSSLAASSPTSPTSTRHSASTPPTLRSSRKRRASTAASDSSLTSLDSLGASDDDQPEPMTSSRPTRAASKKPTTAGKSVKPANKTTAGKSAAKSTVASKKKTTAAPPAAKKPKKSPPTVLKKPPTRSAAAPAVAAAAESSASEPPSPAEPSSADEDSADEFDPHALDNYTRDPWTLGGNPRQTRARKAAAAAEKGKGKTVSTSPAVAKKSLSPAQGRKAASPTVGKKMPASKAATMAMALTNGAEPPELPEVHGSYSPLPGPSPPRYPTDFVPPPMPKIEALFGRVDQVLLNARIEATRDATLQSRCEQCIETALAGLDEGRQQTILCLMMNRYSAFCGLPQVNIPCFPITNSKLLLFFSRVPDTPLVVRILSRLPQPDAINSYSLPRANFLDPNLTPEEGPRVTQELVKSWVDALAYAQTATREVWEPVLDPAGWAKKQIEGMNPTASASSSPVKGQGERHPSLRGIHHDDAIGEVLRAVESVDSVNAYAERQRRAALEANGAANGEKGKGKGKERVREEEDVEGGDGPEKKKTKWVKGGKAVKGPSPGVRTNSASSNSNNGSYPSPTSGLPALSYDTVTSTPHGSLNGGPSASSSVNGQTTTVPDFAVASTSTSFPRVDLSLPLAPHDGPLGAFIPASGPATSTFPRSAATQSLALDSHAHSLGGFGGAHAPLDAFPLTNRATSYRAAAVQGSPDEHAEWYGRRARPPPGLYGPGDETCEGDFADSYGYGRGASRMTSGEGGGEYGYDRPLPAPGGRRQIVRIGSSYALHDGGAYPSPRPLARLHPGQGQYRSFGGGGSPYLPPPRSQAYPAGPSAFSSAYAGQHFSSAPYPHDDYLSGRAPFQPTASTSADVAAFSSSALDGFDGRPPVPSEGREQSLETFPIKPSGNGTGTGRTRIESAPGGLGGSGGAASAQSASDEGAAAEKQQVATPSTAAERQQPAPAEQAPSGGAASATGIGTKASSSTLEDLMSLLADPPEQPDQQQQQHPEQGSADPSAPAMEREMLPPPLPGQRPRPDDAYHSPRPLSASQHAYPYPAEQRQHIQQLDYPPPDPSFRAHFRQASAPAGASYVVSSSQGRSRFDEFDAPPPPHSRLHSQRGYGFDYSHSPAPSFGSSYLPHELPYRSSSTYPPPRSSGSYGLAGRGAAVYLDQYGPPEEEYYAYPIPRSHAEHVRPGQQHSRANSTYPTQPPLQQHYLRPHPYGAEYAPRAYAAAIQDQDGEQRVVEEVAGGPGWKFVTTASAPPVVNAVQAKPNPPGAGYFPKPYAAAAAEASAALAYPTPQTNELDSSSSTAAGVTGRFPGPPPHTSTSTSTLSAQTSVWDGLDSLSGAAATLVQQEQDAREREEKEREAAMYGAFLELEQGPGAGLGIGMEMA